MSAIELLHMGFSGVLGVAACSRFAAGIGHFSLSQHLLREQLGLWSQLLICLHKTPQWSSRWPLLAGLAHESLKFRNVKGMFRYLDLVPASIWPTHPYFGAKDDVLTMGALFSFISLAGMVRLSQ